mgnify:CR=1 FL=1
MFAKASSSGVEDAPAPPALSTLEPLVRPSAVRSAEMPSTMPFAEVRSADGRDLVVKVSESEHDDKCLQTEIQFYTEANRRKLPGIPTMHGHTSQDGRVRLVMDRLGSSIQHVLDHTSLKKLQIDSVLAVGMRVLCHLEIIHEKGMLHRDLKPQNLMLGRGQDREALTMFVQTIAQTLGPEVLMKFINPTEAIKRLAAAQGIDVLGLVKNEEELMQDKQQMMGEQQNQTLLEQAGQFANSKLADGQNLESLQQGQQTPPPTE